MKTTYSTSANDVMQHLLLAQAALAPGEDDHLADLLQRAVAHRTAFLSTGKVPSAAPPPDKRIVRALEHLHANLGDRRKTSLAHVARIAAMSPSHLSRRFHAAVGVTLREYALQQRLVLACALLSGHQHMPLVDVAFSSGLSSQSALCFEFRRRFGCTPRQWRRKAAGK